MKSEKGFMYLLIAAEAIILVLVILFGVVRHIAEPEKPEETGREENRIEEITGNAGAETEDLMSETEENEQIPTVNFSEEIKAVLAEMSREEQVAQLFLVSPETLTGTDRVTIAGNGTRNALEAYPVGGIVYAEQNYQGQAQMQNLIRGAREMSNEQNGRYLFAGIAVDMGGETVVVNVPEGQEAVIAEIIQTDDAAGLEEMEHILLVEALPFEKETERLCCYHVTDGAISAVDAMNNGADMLCVTDDFEAVYEAVLAAAENGELPDTVLRNVVGRILTKKQDLSQ